MILNDEVTRRTTHSIKLPITWKQIKIRLESCGYTCTEVYPHTGLARNALQLRFCEREVFFLFDHVLSIALRVGYNSFRRHHSVARFSWSLLAQPFYISKCKLN